MAVPTRAPETGDKDEEGAGPLTWFTWWALKINYADSVRKSRNP